MNAFSHEELSAVGAHPPVMSQSLAPVDMLEVLLGRHFGVEYQPIVSVQAEEVTGYQASARFRTADMRLLDTGRMFAHLHQNPLLLFHTELQMKKLQIERFPFGSHAANQLMLDLDIDSFMEAEQEPANPFVELFKQHSWSECELVINLVENRHAANIGRSQRVTELLQQNGIAVAMEDAGVRWDMLSLSAFLDAAVIKFNGAELQRLNASVAEATVDWLVNAARRIGVQTLMTGISDCRAFEWARRLGVDCVRGSLFDRQNVAIR